MLYFVFNPFTLLSLQLQEVDMDVPTVVNCDSEFVDETIVEGVDASLNDRKLLHGLKQKIKIVASEVSNRIKQPLHADSVWDFVKVSDAN